MKKKKFGLQPKLLGGLVALSLVLVLTLTITVSLIYRSQMEKTYSRQAFETATVAASFIDGDTIAKYRETLQKDEYYETVRRQLQVIRNAENIRYLYVVIPEDVQFYIWDTGPEGDPNVCDLGDTEDFYGDGDQIMHEAFSANAEKKILITNNDTYGYLASAYVAVLDSRGQPAALASVDLSLDEINRQLTQFYLVILGIAVALVLGFCIFYYRYLKKVLIRPIKTLYDDTQKLVSDQMEHLEGFQNQIHTGDELQSLGESFEHMTRELQAYIDHLAVMTAEKERIGAELNIASRIQADMLPSIFPAFPNRHEIDLYATMDPAKEVGGDFYDFFFTDEDHLALVIADVSGKGVPAALFMVIAKTLIKNSAMSNGSPAAILTQVNEQLYEGNAEEYFVTVWLAILDLRTGKGLAANAGHEHPVIRRKGGEYELVLYRHSPPVGTMSGIRFREHEFELHPGDKLFVYTDGVAEATNSSNELFGTDRMLEALNAAGDCSQKERLKAVKQSIDAFVGDAPQFDDITMLGLTYYGRDAEN